MTESTVKSLPVVVAERDRTAPALTPVRFVAPLNLRCPPLQFPNSSEATVPKAPRAVGLR
jgi:hypothetical protein